MAEPEQVLLEPKGDKNHEKYVVNPGKGSSGRWLTKLQLALLALLVILLIIIIIILAAVLGVERAKNQREKTGIAGKDKDGGKTTTGPPSAKIWDKLRLPSTMTPMHYGLDMNIDPNQEKFSGHVVIHVNVTRETPYVMVHSQGLNITKVSVRNTASKDELEVKRHFLHAPNQYHVTEVTSALKPSLITVTYEFVGAYGQSVLGLFRGTYKKADGTDAYFVATQFEPHYARTAFPCFDEPALKATFNTTITHPSDMQAFTNGAQVSSAPKGNLTMTSFATSPKMQTYLNAFDVGYYELMEKTSNSGVKVRTIARPGRKDQMPYALKAATESLNQLEQFFGIPYPLPKLDLIATPECLVAMENWGLIHMEEDGLLYKEEFSNEEIKQNLLIRWLPHEIAHMWFGNLVTMSWWDDLWLNEAFADYYNYHEASPISNMAWNMPAQFVQINVCSSLELDGYESSRPVVEPVNTPSLSMFDDIVYKKGSSVIRMIVHKIGHDKFTRAMKKYLKKHSYGNANTNDVWAALESVTQGNGIYYKNVFEPWVHNVGFPVVTIRESSGKYIASQKRFFYLKDKTDQTKWYIPFSYVTGADDARVPPETNFSVWIEPSKSSVNITWDGNGWIKGNYGQTGFYRVNYPEANWDNLARQLEATPTVFSELDRYGLIDDSFNLARANMLNITKAMDITVYLTKETEYLPWKGAEMNLNYIKKILKHGGHTYRHLMKYLAFQSKTILKKLGYENTGTHLDKLQRLMAVHFQCEAGEKTCLGNMTAMFNEWKKDHMSFSVTPVLRKLVYHYGVALGTPEDWERVYNRIHTSVIASEMQPLLYGLAGSRDIWTLNKFLQMTMDQMKIKEQYSKHVIDFVANENPAGAEVAWSFIRANWGKLKKMSGGSVGAMLTYLPSVTKRFSTDYQLQQLTEFIEENLDGQKMPRQLEKVIEVVKINIQWRATHEKSLEAWLVNFLTNKNIPSSEMNSGFSDPA